MKFRGKQTPQTGFVSRIHQLYHAMFSHKKLPGAGAGEFVWNTYQQPRVSPIGAGTQVRHPFVETQQPLYAFQMTVPTGMYAIAGQLYSQPLFDPNAPGSGYVTPIMEPYR